ncbi:D-Ala-D-Ala carboxypeptidase family metallohydrolase [Paracoccus sp. TOH]|uniref:D-Ala-D-Ala carboxypeptidase family metallohydrolase n=1 Tax=Paracoccus sp. TOH TaxID=1263728 RepID=UPI0025B06FED|nr:D-Ala-D-Ala carboxypeptidase family metallohydrolase [Paracoccus sp. TOH]WJS85885.1 D-Ala-D-Ala carboxypeptidase family metallohydrolase [Paracoccus sp. TOH]
MPLAEFPRAGWCWPNFRPEEPACKDGSILILPPTVDKLQRLRDRLGAPLVVNSAFRSPGYNKRVGGAAGSMHLAARAFDIRMAGHDPHQFEAAAPKAGFTGFGLGAQTDIPIPASRMIRPPARIMLCQRRLARCALNPHKRGENPLPCRLRMSASAHAKAGHPLSLDGNSNNADLQLVEIVKSRPDPFGRDSHQSESNSYRKPLRFLRDGEVPP